MFLNSCSLAYQSHNSCDPLSFPPTSCSTNYELGGCKRARTCSFAHCLAIATCLTACCAFVVNPRFRFGILMGVHTNPFGFFCGRCFLHFLLLLLSKLHQIEPLHANWLFTMLQLPPILHFKLYFFLSPFALFYYALLLFCQLFFFFCKIPKIFNRSHYM